jgi:hypothetical protein
MYVALRGSADVDTITVPDGKRAKWKTLTQLSPSTLRLSTDGRAWVYGEYQNLSTLFVADGLR